MIWGTPVPSRLLGDVIALCGAAGGVLTLVAAARRRGELVLSAFTLLMTAATIPVFLAASAALDTPPPAPTASPHDGASSTRGCALLFLSFFCRLDAD